MNAEPTHDFREQAEARIVALLLGEASPFEEAAVQDLLKQDAGLAAFHEDMKWVLSLVQAASAHSNEAKSTISPPPQLSPEGRRALLQKLEKTVAAPAAIVPFPFWRRHWFMPAAAAASVLGLLGLFLWFYEGNLRPRFQISNSLTGSPKNPFVGRYAYVAGAKSQPATSPERDLASPKAPDLGLALAIKEQPPVANATVPTRFPSQIVLPTEPETLRGVEARGKVELAETEGKKLFYDVGVAKDTEVSSREIGAELDRVISELAKAGKVSVAGGAGGGGGFGGGGGDIVGGRSSRAISTPGVSGDRASKRGYASAAKPGAGPEQTWDEKKPAAGYPFSAGSMVVLPQGEAKQDRFNTDYDVQTGKELKGEGLSQDGFMDRLQSAGSRIENRWGMVAETPTAGVRFQEAQKPQSPMPAEISRVPTLGDTPMLGQLFRKDNADTTAETKMVPLKVELPKLAFSGTPADMPSDKHIESPEETQAAREALFRSSMNKRGDVASVDSKQRVIEVAPVPAPERTNFVWKLAEESVKAGKPAATPLAVTNSAAIAPSQKAISELGLTKERLVERDAFARTPRVPLPTPQPEMETRNNAFSTFSLNVSDVSFRLAAASLEQGAMPDPASIRSEEFVNAFDYRDPLPQGNARLSFAWERARYPFAHNREIVRLAIRTAARGREPGRPLNLVVALDHSGSMERADRVAIVQEAMKVLAGQLQPQDRISVILFARTAQLWVDGLAGGKPQELLNRIRELNPQGGTNVEDALALAYQTALKHFQTNGNNRVVLMTDGAANLGNVDPSALQQTVETHRKKGIALDCFGIGWEGFNDDLLEVLARHGDGRYGFLNSVEVVKADFANQLAGALQVAAADVKAQVEFNPKRVTTFRQVGYARHQLTKEQFRDNTVDAAEIGAAESGNALYVIQVNPQGEGPLGVVRVRFKVPTTGEYQERSWDLPFQGRVTTLDQAAASLRLAAASAAFAEWLANSPYAAEVNLGALESQLNGVAETFAPDPRPQRLAWMIRQARSISGK